MYSENQLLKAIEKESAENGIKVFEDIKDKDGHARFIDGIGEPVSQEGIETTYCKWSLSGSHLLIVLAGNVANTTVVSYNTWLMKINNLPEWIKSKIINTFGNIVEQKTCTFYHTDGTTQSIAVGFSKTTSNIGIITTGSSVTLSKDRSFRIAFDLLIDND